MPISPTTTQVGLSVRNATELALVNVTSFSAGELAYKQDDKTYWSLDRTATSGGIATADGYGRWLPFAGGSSSGGTLPTTLVVDLTATTDGTGTLGSPFNKIQSAINALTPASVTRTILVGSGVSTENLVFPPTGIDNVVIEGTGIAVVAEGSPFFGSRSGTVIAPAAGSAFVWTVGASGTPPQGLTFRNIHFVVDQPPPIAAIAIDASANPGGSLESLLFDNCLIENEDGPALTLNLVGTCLVQGNAVNAGVRSGAGPALVSTNSALILDGTITVNGGVSYSWNPAVPFAGNQGIATLTIDGSVSIDSLGLTGLALVQQGPGTTIGSVTATALTAGFVAAHPGAFGAPCLVFAGTLGQLVGGLSPVTIAMPSLSGNVPFVGPFVQFAPSCQMYAALTVSNDPGNPALTVDMRNVKVPASTFIDGTAPTVTAGANTVIDIRDGSYTPANLSTTGTGSFLKAWLINERYVDINSPAGGDGTYSYPFNTIQAAIDSIPGPPTKATRYAIMIAPGIYPENIALRPWAFLVGTDAFVTRLTGTLSLPANLWNPPDNVDDNFTDMRCGFQAITFTAAQTFNFNVGAQPGSSFQGSNEGKLYWTDCLTNGLITVIAFSLINQTQSRHTQHFGGFTQQGMQVQFEETAITGAGALTISDGLNITGGPIPAIFNAFGGATNGPVSVTSASGALATVVLQGFALSSTLSLTGSSANVSYTSSPEGIPINPTFSGGVTSAQIIRLNDGFAVAYTNPSPSPWPNPAPTTVNQAITELAGVAIFSGDVQVTNGVSKLVAINGFPIDPITTAAPPAGYFLQSDGTKWIAAPSGSGPSFSVTSFTSPAGTLFPVGTSLANPLVLNATYNMVPTSADNIATAGPSPVAWVAPYNTVSIPFAYVETVVNTTVTFTLQAASGAQNATRQLAITWTAYIRWDEVADPGAGNYTAAFIQGLANQQLQTTFNANVTMNVGAGNYAFEAFPSVYGTPTFYITQTGQPQNPFAGGMSLVAAAVPINVNGVMVPMDLYRSDFPSLGSNSFLTN